MTIKSKTYDLSTINPVDELRVVIEISWRGIVVYKSFVQKDMGKCCMIPLFIFSPLAIFRKSKIIYFKS